MRKVDDGEKKKKRKEKKKENNDVYSGHYVIASSLPPERLRLNDDHWNAARSCQLRKLKEQELVLQYEPVYIAYLPDQICNFAGSLDTGRYIRVAW